MQAIKKMSTAFEQLELLGVGYSTLFTTFFLFQPRRQHGYEYYNMRLNSERSQLFFLQQREYVLITALYRSAQGDVHVKSQQRVSRQP